MGLECNYSEQSMRILESISDAFYALDKEWTIIYVNGKLEELWNRNRADLLGRKLMDIFPEFVCTKGGMELQRAMRERVMLEFDTFSRFLHAYIACRAIPAQDGGLEIYVRDITHQLLQQKSEQAEKMLHMAIEATDVSFWHWDLETNDIRYIYTPPGRSDVWMASTIQESFASIHPDDMCKVDAGLQAIQRGEKSYSYDFRRILPDGKIAWFLMRGEIFYDNAGRPEQAIGIIQDITRTKELEQQEELLKKVEEIKRREEELLEILDGASDGSWIINIPEKLRRNSNKWKDLLGADDLDEHAQFSRSEEIHPDDKNGCHRRTETLWQMGISGFPSNTV